MISSIVINRPEGTQQFIRESHIDVLDREWTYEYLAPQDISQAELDANLAANAIRIEGNLAEQEIQEWIQEIESGRDPAHVDAGGFYVHSVPNFNAWEVATDGSVTPFLQSEYRQDILPINDLWGRLTNAERSAIAGQPNDVSSELQISINAQISLDAYIPLIDEEGNPRA